MPVQSVLIPKDKFTLQEAKKFIKDNGYKLTYYGKSVDITRNYYRYRQRKPTGHSYYISTIKGGVKLVMMGD